MAEEPLRRIVVGLGPGRCGTSILMRMLHECGLRLSTHLVPASPDNLDGHHEDALITNAQQRFLAGANLSRHAPRPASLLTSHRAPALVTELAQIVKAETAGQTSLWGFKDPRTCLTWPLWQAVFAETRTTPVPLYCVRDSRATVQSIMRAYDMTQDVAEGLCLFRSVQILLDVKEPWLFVHFARWSTHAEQQLALLVEHCGLAADQEKQRQVVAAHFRPELDRQSTTRSIEVSPVLRELDDLLASCVGRTYDPTEIDRWCHTVIQRVDDFAFLQAALDGAAATTSRDMLQNSVRATARRVRRRLERTFKRVGTRLLRPR